jgi:glycosyltransferase involved in cell wall biosynthesis
LNSTRTVRVLHVIPTLDQSGAEKQLSLLALHLPKDAFDVHVCTLTRGGPFEKTLRDAGIPVHSISKRLKWDPMALYRLYRYMADLKPDIVQTWIFAANCYGRVAARWAGVPHILASERCIDEWKGSYHFAIDRRLARQSSRIIVNADAIGEFLVRNGIEREKIVTIKNAVVAEDLIPQNSYKTRAGLGVPNDGPLIGCIGRLWPQKRVQDLIWAADILRLSGWKVSILVIGDGPRRASLERFAESLEITDLVRFLGHRSDVSEILPLLDLVVLPSSYEGLPNVLLEAMAAGKPVVACRIPGVNEVVIEGQTGLLVPPKNPLELARAIRTLLDDPVRRVSLGAAGRRRVVEEFSLARMIDQYQGLYFSLMGRTLDEVQVGKAGVCPVPGAS